MADPVGPTVADDPDEVRPAGSASGDTAPADAAPPAQGDVAHPAPTGPSDVQEATGPVETEGSGRVAPTSSHAAPVPAAPDEVPPTPVEPPVDAEQVAAEPSLEAAAKEPRETAPVSEHDDPGDDDHPDQDPDVDQDEDQDAPGAKGGLLTRQVQVEAKHIVIVAAVLGALFGAYLLGHNQGKDLGKLDATGTTSSTTFKAPKDFVPITDDPTGVKISVPNDWVRYSTAGIDPQIRLAVGVPKTNDTVIVRVNSYSSEVTKDNVADQKNVFDSLLSGEKITILVNQAVTVKGLPALFYVYSFTDTQTGKTGIHAHYFVFQGRKMVSMVFQALPPDHPEDRYKELSATYDTIARSLEVTPGPPPAFLEEIKGTTTTAAGGTTSTTAGPATSTPASTPTSAATPPTSR